MSTYKSNTLLSPPFHRLPPALTALLLAFSLSSLAAVVPAWAQAAEPDLTDLSLEDLMQVEVVYGASKHEQKVSQAPASISLVTSDEIQKYGYRTLADVLRSAKGFYVSYDRNYSYVGTRGFARAGDYNTRILLLVDGHRVNDNIYDAVLLGTEGVVSMDLVDRVEIIRGPSSSIYGTNAFFGVINIVTKRAHDLPGAALTGQAGSFRTYGGEILYGARTKAGLDVVLAGSRYDSRGQRLYFPEFDGSATNFGVTDRTDTDGATNLFANVASSHFTLQAAHVTRAKRIPTASFGTVFNDPRNHTTDARSYANLRYEREMAKGLSLMSRFYYDRYRYDGEYIYDLPPIAENRDYGWGDDWGNESKLTVMALERHTLLLGAEYRDNFHQAQGNYDVAPAYSYFKDARDSEIWAFYAQDESRLLKNLNLSAGLRYDHYETFGGTTNPRLGLIYAVEDLTSLKLLYGKAFRSPTLYESFYSGIGLKVNPNLKPERIETVEVVLEQRLGKYIRVTGSGFHYRLSGLITLEGDTTDGLAAYRNVERIAASGMELEVEGKWSSGWSGRASYSYQDSHNEETGERLTNSPRHMARSNVVAPLVPGKLFGSVEFQYISDRLTLNHRSAGAFLVANTTVLARRLWKSVEASATVYNVTDRRYGDPGSEEHVEDVITQDPRTVRVKLSYRL